MKNPLPDLRKRFGEMKGRTLLLVIGVVVIFIFAIVLSMRGTKELTTIEGETSANKNPRTSTVRAPNIESTPGVGSTTDTAYIELQRQANERRAEAAIQTGKSAVATVTNDQFVDQLTYPEPGIATIPGAAAQQKNSAETQKQQSLQQYQRLYQEQLLQEQQRVTEQQREQQQQQQAEYQEAYEGLMATQAKNLMGQWQPRTQTYVHNDLSTMPEEYGPSTAPSMPPMYKAGDIIFGVMETAVDSDEPGPVLVRVVSGPLTGAKLIGSFRRVEAQVYIEFSLLSAPSSPTSLPVKAVAIDPITARTALSTGVDYHRLLRYSTLFASAFLEGVGDAVLAGIQPDFTVDGSTFAVSNVSVGTKDQVLVGLGEVGAKAGEKLDKYFDIPPTVTVDSGTPVGLLFIQDFSLQPGDNSNATPNVVQLPSLPSLTPTGLTGNSGAGTMPASNVSTQPTTMVKTNEQ